MLKIGLFIHHIPNNSFLSLSSNMEGKSGYLMERYELGRLLGQGTFAKVYFARNLKSNQSVAVKIIDKEKCMRVGLMNMVKREISVLHKVRHPNIVDLYEVMATRTKIYFVMEYAKGGELFDKVSQGGRLREDVAHKYFQQLIHAVDFCHSRGIYHRDIKLENLLLDANGDLKVTDFGLCALAESRRQDGLLHTACGTPSYVAPEVILQKGYDGAKSDIWSCGVVLFVLLAGYPPFYDRHLLELYRKIDKAEFKFPKWFPQDIRQLLLKILNPNPESRISMAKIKESSWFQKEFTSKSHITDAKGKSVGSSYGGIDTELNEESIRPAQLNAFDILTLSRRFDLSGLFVESDKRKETRFSSRQPAPVIVSRLLETAKHLRFRIRQIAKGVLNFEASSAGRKGPVSIDAEIFEVTPAVFLVELRKSDGDTLEYRKAIKEDIRPALKDIVWTWQGEKQQC